MKKISTILAICGFLGVVPARAELMLTLTPATHNATPGVEMIFSGTLSNTNETNRLFLNDIQASFVSGASNSVQFDANEFFANVPGLLLPGEAYTGAVFRVFLPSNAPGGDYVGSITLRGGADIFATNELASAAFLISSISVSVAASDATASEWGPDPGAFTVSRRGSTNMDLTVFFSIGGSATNGVTYNLIPTSVVIPAGEASATITLMPLTNELAESKRTAVLTLQPNVAYGVESNMTATVTIHDTPFDVWRLQKFGAAANSPSGAANGDWDSDGIQNILEYALNLEPTIPNVRALAAPQIVDDHLTWSYVLNPNSVGVVPIVEASTNLIDWSAADVEIVVIPNPDPPTRVTVRYRHPVSLTPQAFLRLRAIRVQP